MRLIDVICGDVKRLSTSWTIECDTELIFLPQFAFTEPPTVCEQPTVRKFNRLLQCLNADQL